MLLSHIDDMIKVNKEFNYGFQIYETLIEQWLNRESIKAGIIAKYGSKYKSMLFEFSKALARDLYQNKNSRNNRLSLNVNEIIDNPMGLQLKDIEGSLIEIDRYDQSSRSLLNRNAIGEYKFSHKSILEYFLALEAYQNIEFRDNFYFDSDLDTAKRFFIERIRFDSLTSNEIDEMNLRSIGIMESTKQIQTKSTFSKSYKDIINILIRNIVSKSFSRLSILGSFMVIIYYGREFFIKDKFIIFDSLELKELEYTWIRSTVDSFLSITVFSLLFVSFVSFVKTINEFKKTKKQFEEESQRGK